MAKGSVPARTKQFKLTSPNRPGLDKGGNVQNVRTRGTTLAGQANAARAYAKNKSRARGR